jgi:hypothetical protein
VDLLYLPEVRRYMFGPTMSDFLYDAVLAQAAALFNTLTR